MTDRICIECGTPLSRSRQKAYCSTACNTTAVTKRNLGKQKHNPEVRAQITLEWNDDIPAAVIGKRHGMSKSAVIALAHRMRLRPRLQHRMLNSAQEALLASMFANGDRADAIIAAVNALPGGKISRFVQVRNAAKRAGARRPPGWAAASRRKGAEVRWHSAPKAPKAPKPDRKKGSPREIPERQLRNIGMQLDLPLSQRGNLDAVNRAWKKLPDDDPLKQEHGGCPSFTVVTYKQYRSGAAA